MPKSVALKLQKRREPSNEESPSHSSHSSSDSENVSLHVNDGSPRSCRSETMSESRQELPSISRQSSSDISNVSRQINNETANESQMELPSVSQQLSLDTSTSIRKELLSQSPGLTVDISSSSLQELPSISRQSTFDTQTPIRQELPSLSPHSTLDISTSSRSNNVEKPTAGKQQNVTETSTDDEPLITKGKRRLRKPGPLSASKKSKPVSAAIFFSATSASASKKVGETSKSGLTRARGSSSTSLEPHSSPSIQDRQPSFSSNVENDEADTTDEISFAERLKTKNLKTVDKINSVSVNQLSENSDEETLQPVSSSMIEDSLTSEVSSDEEDANRRNKPKKNVGETAKSAKNVDKMNKSTKEVDKTIKSTKDVDPATKSTKKVAEIKKRKANNDSALSPNQKRTKQDEEPKNVEATNNTQMIEARDEFDSDSDETLDSSNQVVNLDEEDNLICDICLEKLPDEKDAVGRHITTKHPEYC